MHRYKKIVFLVTILSQPRIIRRIETIANLGYDIEVYGYDRSKYNCNILRKDIKLTVLRKMQDRSNYLLRIWRIRQDLNRIFKNCEQEDCIYYSFGFIECLLLGIKKKPYFYEISDIPYNMGGLMLLRPLLKMVDKHLIEKSVCTIMTSTGFKEYFNANSDNIIVIPNKVNNYLRKCSRVPLAKHENNMVFSFAGFIRYSTMIRFATVIGKWFPHHQFHFYGVADSLATKMAIEELTETYPNVKLYGEYKNPDDLEIIYNGIDVVVATYGNTSLNERILDPNKLYESIFFCRPIIVSQGTFLAKQVEKYMCGIVIDSSSEETIKQAVEKLTFQQLNTISKMEKQIEESIVFDDIKQLSDIIKANVLRHRQIPT